MQFDNAFNAGVDLYHLGYLWEAHEAWEAEFHANSGAARELAQGLIQLAAAMIKVHIGNEAGFWTTICPAISDCTEKTSSIRRS